LSDSDSVVWREVIFTSLGGNAFALEDPPLPVVSVDALPLSFLWPEDLSPAKALNAVPIANAIVPNVRMLTRFNLIDALSVPLYCSLTFVIRFPASGKGEKVIPK